MKFPKSLNVGGLSFEIKQSKEVSREGHSYGSTHLYTQHIFLDPELSQQKKEQTFIHEILHAIWNQYGLARNEKFTEKDEELIVDSLANGLYQVLKENGLLK